MFFEDFELGHEYATYGRTLTDADVVIFASMTGAVNPLFLDEEYAKHTRFGGRIAPGLLTMSTVLGLIYQLPQGFFTEGFVALIEARGSFLASVKPGDTISSRVKVSDKKEVSGGRGLVTLSFQAFNQGGQKISEGEFRIMVSRRPREGPSA
ncbi:MAG: MaoC/PaaZ C-terminal domain-containing protein [Conexivisphaerales archaeon]|nr:MaoC/PaaZ C-terminal domain-containing protein [Conexivisphaerales archaeon]